MTTPVPQWIQDDNPTHPADIDIRDAMIRYLYDSSTEEILRDTRGTIRFNPLLECSQTYVFALYKLLLEKGVHIPDPSDSDMEEGLHSLLCKFLFPALSQQHLQDEQLRSATISAPPSPPQAHDIPQPLEPSNDRPPNDARQFNGQPQGSSLSNSNGFEPFRFQRVAHNQHHAHGQGSNTARNMQPAYSQLPDRVPRDVSLNPPPDGQSFNIAPFSASNTQVGAPTSQPLYGQRSNGNISNIRSQTNSRVTLLPIRRPFRGRPGDMAKYYSARGSRYTGRKSDLHSLARHQAVYYAQAHLCGLNAAEGLECLMNMIETHSLAGRFFYNEVFQQVPTLEAAFQKLFTWSYSSSNMAANLREWRNLKITSFKSECDTWSDAMTKLYERALMLQDQLDSVHQHPTLLLEVLESAIISQSFFLFVDRAKSSTTPEEYYNECLSAIHKQEIQDSRTASSLNTDLVKQISDIHSSPRISFPTQPPDSVSSASSKITEALYARAGRRYGTDNRINKFAKKNGFRNGVRMLCRACRSDSHLIRDCPKIRKPTLVNIVFELVPDDEISSLSVNQILDVAQDLPDNVWITLSTEIMVVDIEPTVSTAAQDVNNHQELDISQTMYTRLVSWADQHEILSENQTSDVMMSAFETPQKNEEISTSIVMITAASSHSLPELNKAIYTRVLQSMKNKSAKFEGVMIDNGAAKSPTGLPAYIRYCVHTATRPFLRPSSRAFRGIGHGMTQALGTASIRMPIGSDVFLTFDVDVVDQDVPLIFGLEHHRNLKCSSNEYKNTFTHHPSGTVIPVSFIEGIKGSGGHLYIKWTVNNVLFTEPELRKLHNQFGHPATDSLVNLLKKASPEKVNTNVRKTLEDIIKKCSPCQTWAPRASRFRVSFPTKDIVFNHEIEVDVFFIDGDPILHIIDRGTRYSVAKFMTRQTAEYTWNLIVDFWITVFTGYPSVIAHDQGENFLSDFFQNSCSQLGITTKDIPVESPNSLSICERYHGPIRRVYNKLKNDFPVMDKNIRLSLSVHAVNTTTGPNGITPCLLLFGTVPRLPLPNVSTMAPTQKQRFEAMAAARKEMETITAQRRVAAALKHRAGVPHPVYEFGDKVRIFRKESRRFEGPYTVHSYDNRKTVFVQIGNNIKPFSTSVVKRAHSNGPINTSENALAQAVNPQQPSTLAIVPPESTPSPHVPMDIVTELNKLQEQFGSVPQALETNIVNTSQAFLSSTFAESEVSRLYENGATSVFATIVVHNKKDPRFDDAKNSEVEQLVKKGTYEFVRETDLPEDATILQSRFILTIKNFEKPDEQYKARLVILGHMDPEKPRVVNEAPTVLKSSIRLTLALIVSHGFDIWSRDISQAFLQSDEPLRRTVYVRPPKGENVLQRIGAPPGTILRAIKAQYGLCDSPGYWWPTFQDWHTGDLGMQSSVLDPCLFYKVVGSILEGIQVTQVDDTCGGGTPEFSNLEEEKSQHFECKPRTNSFPIQFNGFCFDEHESGGYVLHQNDYCTNLKSVDYKSDNGMPKKFASGRGQVSYASTCTRPEVSFDNAQLSQIKAEHCPIQDTSFLNKAIQKLNNPAHLVYRPLDLSSVYIAGYSDASFANNSDLSSQIGFIVLLKDKQDNASIIHYGSWKSQRVTRSILGAEVMAFTHCLDFVLALAHDLSTILCRKVSTVLFTDSKCLFDTITKLSTVSEKRLLIDIAAIRESYTNGDLSNVAHVTSKYNLADVFTKKNASAAMLQDLMSTGRITHPVNQWIIPEK